MTIAQERGPGVTGLVPLPRLVGLDGHDDGERDGEGEDEMSRARARASDGEVRGSERAQGSAIELRQP